VSEEFPHLVMLLEEEGPPISLSSVQGDVRLVLSVFECGPSHLRLACGLVHLHALAAAVEDVRTQMLAGATPGRSRRRAR